MDRAQVHLALQLLAKAEGTDAEPEALALVERCYRLLAEVITKHDLENGQTVFGPRRRERRWLRDRRASRRGGAPFDPAVESSDKPRIDSSAAYRQADDRSATDRSRVDYTL